MGFPTISITIYKYQTNKYMEALKWNKLKRIVSLKNWRN